VAKNPLTLAKLNRPQAGKVLIRNRLFAKIDQAAPSPIVWIAAPGGAGKTILASSYLEQRRLPHLWYTLDAGDADPATFFYYLGMAGRQAAPRRRHTLPLLTPEFLPGLADFCRNFFAEIFSRLKTPAYIILDDYQQVNAEAPLHDLLLTALDRIPRNVAFLVLSRHEPPPVFAKLRSRRQLTLIGWEDLRLEPSECLDIIALEEKKVRSSIDMKTICARFGGWAAGLRLLLDAGELESDDYSRFTDGGHEAVFDYFASEIFSSITAEEKDFLLRTSFFPQMTGRMSRQLTGNNRADRLLRSLVRRNQFTERRSPSDHYRYHPLFHSFLQAQAEKLFTREETTEIRRQAAGILMEAGMLEGAADLSIKAGDWAGLEQIILLQAPILFRQGRSQTLEQWIGVLPAEILESSPWVHFWLGLSRLFFDQAASRKRLVKAYELFKARGDGVGAYLAWAAIVEGYTHEWDILSPLDEWIAEMEELRQRFPNFSSPEVEMRVISNMFAALALRQPGHPDLDYWRRQAENMMLSAPDITQRLLVGCNLFLYYLWTGNLPKQGFILTALNHLPLDERQLAHAPYLIILRCMEHIHAIFCGAAEEDIFGKEAEIERLISESGWHLFDHKMFYSRIYYRILTGEHGPLPDLLAGLAAAVEHQTVEKCHMYILRAWHAWFVQGDSGKALEFLKIALRLSPEAGFWYQHSFCFCALGHLYTILGDYRHASSHLAQLKESGETWHSDMLLYHYRIFSANLAFAQDEEEPGLSHLRQALTMAREKGFLATYLWWQPEMMADLCRRALDADIETDYTRHLIRKCRLRPDSPPVEIEQWPWPLKVYTLGRFEIVKDDLPFQFTNRAQQKPLLLLKALIALGGRRIHEGHISEILWPEADGDLQHQNFRTTLHRLRKLLDLPEAILYHEGQLTLDPHYCWVDIWAFERLATRAAKELASEPGKALPASRRSLGLYKGRFMQWEESAGWLLPMRERLHNRFLVQVRELGGFYRGNREWRRAINLYWQALAVDPLIVSYYEAIITCHLATGNQAEAARVHASCRETFLELLGAEPSFQANPISGTIPK
jgi:ATP/maltotriose-dependent transcriptional regulator MalT/DNA-binding SARP family transcriptional activator